MSAFTSFLTNLNGTVHINILIWLASWHHLYGSLFSWNIRIYYTNLSHNFNITQLQCLISQSRDSRQIKPFILHWRVYITRIIIFILQFQVNISQLLVVFMLPLIRPFPYPLPSHTNTTGTRSFACSSESLKVITVILHDNSCEKDLLQLQNYLP